MFASTEFVALCQNQIALLTQGLGAALSVVYLAEDLSGNATPNLVPIAAYPETAFADDTNAALSLLPFDPHEGDSPMLHPPEFNAIPRPSEHLVDTAQSNGPDRLFSDASNADRVVPSYSGTTSSADSSENVKLPDEGAVVAPRGLNRLGEDGPSATNFSLAVPLSSAQQVMMPLVHEGVMLGVLMTVRSDRPWFEPEHEQIEQVAQTLALACVLDQRAYWSRHNLRQLQQLQTQQHELFDNLLHQFRNPLTALQTFGKLLLRRLPAQGPRRREREFAESIVRESEHLQDLVQQFKRVVELDTSNLLPGSAEPFDRQADAEAAPTVSDVARDGRLLPGSNALAETLHIQECLLEEVLEPLVQWAQAIAQDRQIHFQALLSPGMPPISADPHALREALNNLIDNALKYTPANGWVEVLSGLQRESGDRFLQGVAIIDNGPGIPAEDQTHLFERRFRGVQAQSNIPGTGLGLAITQDLIRRMQGEIMVFSPAGESGLIPEGEDPRRGTAFLVWLPEV